MFTVIGNIRNLPSREELMAGSAGFTPKEQLAADPKFVPLRYSSQQQALDIISAKTGADTKTANFANAPGFQRVGLADAVVNRLADILKLTKPQARLQVLEPGNVTMMHLDDLDLGYINPIEDSLKTVTFTEQEREQFRNDVRSATRYLIMLEDWQWGQGMMFHDKTLTGWKAGDIIYWDWPTVAHSTFNTSFWPRGLIRITGLQTEGSRKINEWALNGGRILVEY